MIKLNTQIHIQYTMIMCIDRLSHILSLSVFEYVPLCLLLSLYLSVCLPLSLYLSVRLSFCLCLSFSLSVCLSLSPLLLILNLLVSDCVMSLQCQLSLLYFFSHVFPFPYLTGIVGASTFGVILVGGMIIATIVFIRQKLNTETVRMCRIVHMFD